MYATNLNSFTQTKRHKQIRMIINDKILQHHNSIKKDCLRIHLLASLNMQRTLSSQFQPYLQQSLIQIPHNLIKPCYGIRFIRITQSLINEYSLNKKQPYTQDLKFSWQCGWGFKFSTISHCAIGWVVPSVPPLDKTMSGRVGNTTLGSEK